MPVMIFHIAAVHHIDPVTGFHHRFRSDDSVVQRYQYGCGLKVEPGSIMSEMALLRISL